MTDISELRLHVRYDEGEGPVMVMLHGINSTAEDWRKVIDTIGSGYRFVAPDLLGFGESPKPTDIDYNTDELCEVLDNTLVDIGVDSPFLLVGYSLGGDIAIRYAARHPRKVRRLFLLSAPFYLPPTAFQARGFGTQFLQVILFQRIWKWVAGTKKRDALVYQIVNGKAEDFAKGFLHTEDVPASWDIMGKNLRNCIAKATFVDDLPKLNMPVTFALGIRDPIVHPDQTPDLKRLKPDIDIRRIVGLSADHFMLLKLPETVAKEIMRDEITGLNVRYHEGRGAGEPTVFLHGIVEDPTFWRPVAQTLSTRREVALIDLLGFGDSMVPLSSRFGMNDHVAGVAHTLMREFPDTPVHLVGHGFGSDVAIAIAAEQPGLVASVTAFSPLLVPPEGERDTESAATLAALEAIRDRMNQMVGDPRSQVAVEKVEQRVVPTIRTVDNAILPTNPRALLARVSAPLRAILPTEDGNLNREYLKRLFQAHATDCVVEPPGTRWLPLDDAPAATLVIDPGATAEAPKAASLRKPKREAALHDVRSAFASTSNGVLLRGLGMLVLGGWLLLVPQIPQRLITIGFALWVLFEGLTTISGAFGLRRSGKGGWVVWLLVGALSFVVAGLLLVRPELNLAVLALIIGIKALYTGVADLYIVARVSKTPAPKWLLALEGVVGLSIAAFLLIDPKISAHLLKLTLGVYFIAMGFSSVAYALDARLSVRRRIKKALAREPQVEGIS